MNGQSRSSRRRTAPKPSTPLPGSAGGHTPSGLRAGKVRCGPLRVLASPFQTQVGGRVIGMSATCGQSCVA